MAGLGAHTCRQTEDPRKEGFCACGERLPPTTRLRNREFEQQTVEYAAKGLCDPEMLLKASQRRSEGWSGTTLRVGVDWLREFREEAADGANYLVWWLEEHLEHPDRQFAEQALRYLLLAFDEASRVNA